MYVCVGICVYVCVCMCMCRLLVPVYVVVGVLWLYCFFIFSYIETGVVLVSSIALKRHHDHCNSYKRKHLIGACLQFHR